MPDLGSCCIECLSEQGGGVDAAGSMLAGACEDGGGDSLAQPQSVCVVVFGSGSHTCVDAGGDAASESDDFGCVRLVGFVHVHQVDAFQGSCHWFAPLPLGWFHSSGRRPGRTRREEGSDEGLRVGDDAPGVGT